MAPARVAAATQRARPLELGLGGLGRRRLLLDDALPDGDRARRSLRAARDARGGEQQHRRRFRMPFGAASTNCCAAAALSPRASARNAAPSCGAASPRTRDTMPSTSAMSALWSRDARSSRARRRRAVPRTARSAPPRPTNRHRRPPARSASRARCQIAGAHPCARDQPRHALVLSRRQIPVVLRDERSRASLPRPSAASAST